MQALLLESFLDDLAALTPTRSERPRPEPGEVLIAIHASGVTPSDVKNARGGMSGRA